MPHPSPWLDAREVDRIDALVTANDPAQVDRFLTRCLPGSSWIAKIRTAEVAATLLLRRPLGSFNERDCTCLRFRLILPVPVEPGLRFQIAAADDPTLTASGLIRPWDD